MRNKMKKTLCLMASAATAASMAGSAMAAPVAGEFDKCGGKNMAVANVASELLIREDASAEAEVIGYLPSAAGVIVKEMDAEWTQVKSGDVTGYVKTDYLAFGEKAEELKDVYGVLGAVASWNDVKIFSDHEDTSSVIGSVNEGEGFEVLGSSDSWVEILLPSGDMGYIPAEDVTMTAVLDTAVPTDGEYVPAADYAEEVPAEETYIEDVYTEPVVETEAVWEDTTWETEATWEDTTWETETTWEDTTWETEATWEDTTWETEATWEDTTWETEATWEDTTWETEATWEDTTWETEAPTVEETEPPVEETEPPTEETEAPSVNASSSDLDLLAAIIYCEAGNQSMEGKIAVGQVVMNRVASPSFANTIRDVIYEPGQFTPAMTGWLDQVLGSAPQDCYDAATAALNGEGTVGGALYFNTGSGQGIQIGDHQFY